MIRVLNIIGSVSYGGAETFLMNIYRRIDRQKFQFDFAVYETGLLGYKSEIEELGGEVFFITKMSKNIFANQWEIYSLVKKKEYDVVWRHTENLIKALDLFSAYLGGARRTILHSHNTTTNNKISLYSGNWVRLFYKNFVTDFWACSNEAGEYMFKCNDFKVVKNGINLEKFMFNNKHRKNIRDELGVDFCTIYGLIARFSVEKNHLFLLDIFYEIKKKQNNAKLILIGEGPEKNNVIKYALEMGVYDDVIFLDSRSDVNRYYCAIDVFIMPSLFEGFPLTLVEAQACALPILASDVIDESANMTGKVKFMSLQMKPDKWADRAIALSKTKREVDINNIIELGFDINGIVKLIEKELGGNEY